MSSDKEKCFVCHSTENVVVQMPTSEQKFKKWMNILKVYNDDITHLQRRKICLLHFKSELHSVLKNFHAKRSHYWEPLPPVDQVEVTDDTFVENNNKRPLSPTMPSSVALNKKPVNTDLIIKMKNDEITALTNQI